MSKRGALEDPYRPTDAKVFDDDVHAWPSSRPPRARMSRWTPLLAFVGALMCLQLILLSGRVHDLHRRPHTHHQDAKPDFSAYLATAKEQCRFKAARAGPPPGFAKRTENDRVLPNTPRTWIRNATVFTGEEIQPHMDVLLDHGLIQAIVPTRASPSSEDEAHSVDAQGAWLTPGIVDLHTHLGVLSMPTLPTHTDGNSRISPTRPMVRSIDGINEHDQNLRSTLSGGITTALVLPGSLNNIGGQAFPIKLGSLAGRPPSSRVLDPPRSMRMAGEAGHTRDEMYSEASGMRRPDGSTSFRQIKMACGENARKYNLVRLDEAWNFRSMFERAQRLREAQDDFCTSLEMGLLNTSSSPASLRFPTDLEIESLVDVLRGRTKVQTHCYTMNDLDAFVRHANEFGFPIAAFHHAHETHLVPSVLHAAPDHTPAAAIFATNANYKFESYFGTPFNPELMRSHNITPILKSDHPVLDSRRLVGQAAQAHHFGLNEIDALRAVTSAPAHVLGLAHRIGHVQVGMDADVVLWDRHPLTLGATPTAVYVDGTSQFETMHPSGASVHPTQPYSANYTSELHRVRSQVDEIAEGRALAFPTSMASLEEGVLVHLSAAYLREKGRIVAHTFAGHTGVVTYANGTVHCVGSAAECLADEATWAHVRHIDVRGGVVTPGLVSYGGTLGLSDIPSEASASDGTDPSAVTKHLHLDSLRPTARAVDGLVLGGHDMLRARASGVTTIINAPVVDGVFGGLSAHFDTGAQTVLDKGSVRTDEVALHVTITPDGADQVAVSSQLALVRAQLASPQTPAWRRVTHGTLPLVIATNSAHVVAQLILLKRAFPGVHIVLDSAGALHDLAAQLADVDLPVLMPPKIWEYEWAQRTRLPGPPLTSETELSVLRKHGVRVGLRIREAWEAANLLWEATWAAQDAHIHNATDVLELLTTK